MVNVADSRPLVAAVLAVCVALPIPHTAMAGSTRLGIDAEYGHDTNVNRAAIGKEELSDDSVSIKAHAARSFLLSARSGIMLRATVRATEFFNFGDLSSLAGSGRVSYRFQPSPGFTNPWIELAGQLDGFQYRDSDIRDGYAVSTSASIGKYFTDRIRMEAGAGLERRAGRDGEVFDLSNSKIWTALDYKVTAKATVYGSVAWLDGDQVFTIVDRAAYPSTYAYATASGRDPVFAKAFNGVAPWIYRVDARTTVLELGANIAFQGNHALDFGYGWFDSKADQGGGKYDGSTLRIGYLYRFR
jgi:hypothetical protein